MTAEHFYEVFYTVMMTSKATRNQLRKELNISTTTLNNYLKFGVPEVRTFLMMERLETFLFESLGGLENGSNTTRSHSIVG